MPSTASRYAHIDAMRAIAVLLVIWMHTSEVFVPIVAPSVQDRLYEVAHSFDFGRIGVVVFFIISGFVIPASLRGPRAVGCYQFLIRRLFRLYPLYWLSIPFGLLTTWWLWGKEIFDPLRYPSASAFAYRSSEPDVLGRTGASCPRTRHLAQAGDAGHDRIRGGLDYRWPAGGRTAYAGPTQ
ncbi:acyltransferase family protein [Stutzerimonas chloritidismutans]